MATDEAGLITEVRAFTGYDTSIISDSDMQNLVDVGKEEIRAHLGQSNFNFFRAQNPGTLHADRALFWFVCIAAKIRVGEFGGINLTISSIRATNYGGDFDAWKQQMMSHLHSAGITYTDAGGLSLQNISRDNRSYGE